MGKKAGVCSLLLVVALLSGCGVVSTLLGNSRQDFLDKREKALAAAGVPVRTFRFIPGWGATRPQKEGDHWRFYGTNGADGGSMMVPFTPAVFEDVGQVTQTHVEGHMASVAPARYEGKWGILDIRESRDAPQWVVQPRFEDAGPVVDGLAAVKENGLYGFIDIAGEYKIEPKYLAAKYFSQGFAPVQKQDGRWCYIDGGGAESGDFDEAEPYGDAGIAAVLLDGKWGYVGLDRGWLVKPRYDDAWEADQYSRAWVEENGKWVRISIPAAAK